MPALNFKKKFIEAVESGEKKQTIRAFRKDNRHPKPGQTLFLYTGMRTKSCRKLKEVECKHVKQICITEHLNVYIDHIELDVDEKIDLADADGFSSNTAFYDFFRETHGLPFNGLLIKW